MTICHVLVLETNLFPSVVCLLVSTQMLELRWFSLAINVLFVCVFSYVM